MAQIGIGDALPEATFTVMTADGPMPRTTKEAFGGQKVALFAVPGAFTPTCHNNHLPSFITHAEALKARGVDTIACTSVNDVFVMDAWGVASGASGKIEMLADGAGAFAKACGLDVDLGAYGMGLRSRRYAMLVDNMKVVALLIEDEPGQAVASSAESLLKWL